MSRSIKKGPYVAPELLKRVEEMNEKNLEGKWQSTSVRSQGFDTGKLVYDETSNCVDWYLGFNIKSDGTGQLISYEEGESSIS